MKDKPRYTFHYTPVDFFDSLDPAADYMPPAYKQEGFIHCTDGAANMVEVANLHYRQDPRDFYVLYLDKEKISSPIKYEDPNEIYPHIYGPLNRDAIVEQKHALRTLDGSFLPMPEL